MGELKVTQVDLGAVEIDVSKVAPLPTSERIQTITIERTGDGKWCQFPVKTSERDHTINPGLVGQVAFNAICEKCAAMIKTEEGLAFLQSIQAVVAAKPLEARSKVEIVEAEPVVLE